MTVAAAKVCIVTPIHDGWSATRRYLQSAAALTYPNIEIIVVDDGSKDGSARRIAEEFPNVTVLDGDGNLWWAGATNLGSREALRRGADFIFTCNNDVILDHDVISSSVACAESAGNALVGAVVLYEADPNRVWFSGARLDRASGDVLHDTEFWPVSAPPRLVEVLTGMGMLIPCEAFRDLGGFDEESFPHYLADCDFSLRAAARGYELLVCPASRVFNDVSSAWSVREFERGRLMFLFEMLFSKRSAFWIAARMRFYRRHWRRGWIRGLVRLYRRWVGIYVAPLVKRRLLSLVRRRVT